ncbi:hypothetical protein ICE_01936 [Bacillus cereus BAG1X1-2]|nr:hypothetical protein ICE_01936 [Bacillus cereus BAG1X1-2]
MVSFYVTLFLIFGTAIFLFFLSGSSKIKAKNLSLIMICLGINLLTSPMALFIGVMATDSPYSTTLDFFWRMSLYSGNTAPPPTCSFFEVCNSKENKTKQV